MDPKRIVRQGYDEIAERHHDWAQVTRAEERARYAALLIDKLPPGAEVLDLGCGSGVPTTQALAQRFCVTGVDISERQIELARENVPGARFIRADATGLELPANSLDAVVAFYSLIHIPRTEQPELVGSIVSWLRPGGLFVAALGTRSVEADLAADFLGAQMYWSGFDGPANRRMIQDAGLEIVRAREETEIEFGEAITFLWIVAQKPQAQQTGVG